MNKRILFLVALCGLGVCAGCNLAEVTGEACPGNVNGQYVKDQFSEPDNADFIAESIKKSGSCTESYNFCLVDRCSMCDKDSIRVNNDNDESVCLTCKELASCHSKSCDDARVRGCRGKCTDGKYYDYYGDFVSICEYGCNDAADACNDADSVVCDKGEVLNDGICVCDAKNHWMTIDDGCKCEEGFHAEGSVCIKDMVVDGCSLGQIRDDGNVCVCDTANHWTIADNGCKCDDGYEIVNNKCALKPCDGDKIRDENNVCVCDEANHWVQGEKSCRCVDGYYYEDGVCHKNHSEDVVCKTGEILKSDNTCECDVNSHWMKKDEQRCVCQVGYFQDGEMCTPYKDCKTGAVLNENTNKCICDEANGWGGADSDNCSCKPGFLLIDGNCQPRNTCTSKNILNEETNKCECNTGQNWVGDDPNNCKCSSGFLEIDGVCQTESGCYTGAKLNTSTNTCYCDRDNHWEGSDPEKCECMDGYVAINGKCELKADCKTGAKLNLTTNTCYCDKDSHWVGDDADKCACETEFLLIKGECQAPKTCENGTKLNTSTNECACDTDKHWVGDDPAKCSCESGYLLVKGTCEKRNTCGTGAKLNTSTNECYCDTNNHWTGKAESCTCAFGYKLSSGKCVVYKEGDIFTFGKYYMTDTSSKEPIEWKVLEYWEGSPAYYLLISKVGLDVRAFNTVSGVKTEDDETTWENSTLYIWLNGTFKNKAFTASDQSHMWCNAKGTCVSLPSVMTSTSLTAFSAKGGFMTTDASRKAAGSLYVQGKDSSCKTSCAWWTSTTNAISGYQMAKLVRSEGVITERGDTKDKKLMIRPVIWVKF